VRRLQLSEISAYRQHASGFLLTDSATSLTTTTTRKCDKFFLRAQNHSPTKCPRSCGGLCHIFIYRQPSSSFQTTSPPKYWKKSSLVQEIGTLSITWCSFPICACAFLLLGEIFYLCEANCNLNLPLHKRHKNTNILVVCPVQCERDLSMLWKNRLSLHSA
jgi:hypothetical protein